MTYAYFMYRTGTPLPVQVSLPDSLMKTWVLHLLDSSAEEREKELIKSSELSEPNKLRDSVKSAFPVNAGCQVVVLNGMEMVFTPLDCLESIYGRFTLFRQKYTLRIPLLKQHRIGHMLVVKGINMRHFKC